MQFLHDIDLVKRGNNRIIALYEEHESDETDAATRQVMERFFNDVTAAPEPYHYRDNTDPIFLVASQPELRREGQRFEYGRRDILGILGADFPGGIIWNVTRHLQTIDENLTALLSKRREHDGGPRRSNAPDQGSSRA
jgi:hypothetical protein